MHATSASAVMCSTRVRSGSRLECFDGDSAATSTLGSVAAIAVLTKSSCATTIAN